ERLVVPLALRQVVAGLVTRAVHAARLEEQRPQLIAGDHVEQPRRRVTIHLADRTVGALRLRVVVTPLVRDRGVEPEGAHAPASVETDRVPLLVIGRVTRRGA